MEKITSPKLSELVIEAFFDAMKKGEIEIGKALDSERELSEKFEISRSSLREGLSILEFLGVITNKGNRKIVARDYESVQNMLKVLKLTEKNNIIYDFIEFRQFIELEIIKLACEKATIEDIGNIENSLKLIEESEDKPAADFNFHISIAKASHNRFFVAILELLLSMVNDIRLKLIEYPGRKDYAINEYISIVDAIKARDSKLAQRKMLEHLFFIESTMKAINIIEE
jgi:GntR family transcriptional repressor for pyruvate dehydrogenase complex